MTEFKPGDRVVVEADCLPEGGMLATISDNGRSARLDTQCSGLSNRPHFAQDHVSLLGRSLHPNLRVSLHHRSVPPRPPDPEPFTLSNGTLVMWHEPRDFDADWAWSPEDARRCAEGYLRVAAILEWEAEHGEKLVVAE